MSSDSHGPNSTSALLPRRRREPRKLNYDKCAFCRQAKVKCAPERRSWPEQKCNRCAVKMLPCSAPQRKGPAPEGFNQVSQALSSPTSEASEDESVSSRGTKDALLLLALHNILGLVFEEVRALAEEFLSLIKHDNAWKVHLKEADDLFDHYDKIVLTVSNELIDVSKIEARALFEATLKITNLPLAKAQFNKRIDANILKYEIEDHIGMAYLLLMQQIMRQPSLFDSNKLRLLRFRSRFLEDCLKFCERRDIAHMGDLRSSISIAQSYFPRDILHALPGKQKSFLHQWNAGDKDWLGRLLSHLTHDGTAPSHAYSPWRNTDYMRADFLGRIPVHLACLRADYKLFGQVDLSHNMVHAECLGFRSLDIAAITGDRRILKKIVLDVQCGKYAGRQGGPTMRNCLHWAASCGHLKAVEDLCCWFSPALNDIINERDYLGDTPIHLAARFGHTEIVQHLLQFVDWDIMNDPGHYSPFFSAVMGGHIAIMEILHAHSNVDKFEHVESSEDASDSSGGGTCILTPLAEAAGLGFTVGVQYLLKCNEKVPETVNLNSVNIFGSVLQTPLGIAIDNRHTECIAILKKYGAKTILELPASDLEDELDSEEDCDDEG
ncbi:ankyrin [Pyrenochaeta sp. DS3sAY3a]|nr:ankyrin [Pyrenochaeta sp. DS3sAY3a]